MAKFRLLAVVAVAGIFSVPALAGEITGTGEFIDINARSECVYSGLNDNPDGDARDPGGRVQAYGYLVGYHDILDPQDFDPNADFFQPIPGYACNPNRGRDLHAE